MSRVASVGRPPVTSVETSDGGARPRRRYGGWRFLALLLLAILNLQPATASAQSFAIDWHTIDSGGGTSTGGVFSVSGTIGQPDAGLAMTGGNFSLTGGFWSLLSVVQSPGAPTLAISFTSTNTALVSWPSPSTGWVLQQNTNGVGTVNWSNVSGAIQDNGTLKYLVVNPPTGNRFFRLQQP